MNTTFKRACKGLPFLVAAAFATPGSGWAQSDSDEKIRQLEEGIRKLPSNSRR